MQAAALGHVADEGADFASVRQRVAAGDPNLAVEVGDAQQAAEQRGLAGAVGAEQQRDLTGLQRQRHARERDAPSVPLGDVRDLDHREPRVGDRHQRAIVDEDGRLPEEREHARGGLEREVRRRVEEGLNQRVAPDERVHRVLERVRDVADAVAVRVEAAILAPGIAASVARPAHAGRELAAERPDVRQVLGDPVAGHRQRGIALQRQADFVAGDHVAPEDRFRGRVRRHAFGVDADAVGQDVVVLGDEVADVLEQQAVGRRPLAVLLGCGCRGAPAGPTSSAPRQQVARRVVVLERRVLRVHRVQSVAATA